MTTLFSIYFLGSLITKLFRNVANFHQNGTYPGMSICCLVDWVLA